MQFALVLRCAHGVGFLQGAILPDLLDVELGQHSTSPSRREHELPAAQMMELTTVRDRLLRLLRIYFASGFRTLYLTLPVVVAAAGSAAFITSTVFVTIWLVYIDLFAI